MSIYGPHIYNAVAKDLREIRQERKTKVRWEMVDKMALKMALRFKLDDPNFDHDRFLANTFPKETS